MRIADGYPQCVAHSGADLIDWTVTGRDLRGVPITRRLLSSLLDGIPRDGDERAVLSDARFDHAVFTEDVDLRDVRFPERVSFANARFDGVVEMTHVTFDAGADFRSVTFGYTVRLSCSFAGELSFDGASFRGLTDLSLRSTDAMAEISFDDVLCEDRVDALLGAPLVTIQRTRLDRGGSLVVPRGTLSIEDARLARPTLIEGRGTDSMAELLSLRGSDLSGTTLSGFDLREARFAGAHGLDGLRIDGPPVLRRTSGRQTRRLKIADEDDARAADKLVTFAEVAAIYRDLRAGQEGRKDEPGSADFYYGEMEMRRLAAPKLGGSTSRRPTAAGGERLILEAYRWTSGYGLRASRSLATLAALVIAATVAFQAWLIDDPPRVLRTLLFSVRSTVSFVREPRLEGMTLAAEYVQLGLRFAGPVLLALTVLAIRARVRR